MTNIYIKKISMRPNVNSRAKALILKNETHALLNCILIKNHLKDLFNKEYSLRPHGKPYFPNTNFYFNISHSGKYLVIATSNQDLGVDIEIINKKINSLSRRILTSDEENEYIKLKTNKQCGYLTKIWTVKESILKLLGVGLLTPMNSINANDRKYYVQTIKHKNYYLSLSTYKKCPYKLYVI